MKKLAFWSLNFVLYIFCFGISFGQTDSTNKLTEKLSQYNVLWNSQSQNSSESMPLGGGDIGLNVWVEDGDVLFYMSQSGAFDENNQFLKLGRTRLHLEPNIFDDDDCQFSQELKLDEGYVQIKGKTNEKEVVINLWVDVKRPVIHIDVQSTKKIEAEVMYEYWRYFDRELPQNERHSAFSYSGYPGKVTTYKDSVSYVNNSVLWSHRNKSDKLLFDFAVQQQGLENVKDQLINTQKGVTFGGVLLGENMIKGNRYSGNYIDTPYKSLSIKSEKKNFEHKIAILLLNEQVNDYASWEKQILEQSEDVFTDNKWEETKLWWKSFWNRSHIFINIDKNDPTDKSWQVGKNYQLFRYMLGCNAYGRYPSKFNGSLFTFDPSLVKRGGIDQPGNPDYRAWGGGSFTAQNQRLVYWPMLKSGDFDMMPSQFGFYARSLKNVELRTQEYWGHKGASFTEHPETFGLPAAAIWGFESGSRERPKEIYPGTLSNKYVKHHYTNQLEFSYMILEYFKYSQMDITNYLPFIKSSLQFFDEHYQYRLNQRTGKNLDNNGKLVFFPSTAAEMYKLAQNPTDVISALKTILPRMIDLPKKYVSEQEVEYYRLYLKRIPEIPLGIKEGYQVIKPAENWGYVANQEIPELYPVFPYGIYGLGKPNIEIANNTWLYGESNRKRSFVDCWSQVGIFAARLGLIEETAELVVKKLADSERRFPTFWGPGPDWVPDVDHGGAGMINLQEMLLQINDEKIYLFPAWPKEWDVDFKLNAPNNTIIEVSLKDGEIVALEVFPKERAKDVVIKLRD